MTEQFRCLDNAKEGVTFEMETPYDEYPDASWLEQEGFEDRLELYRAGTFELMGVRAKATVIVARDSVPSSFAIYTLRSPGVWGVESDSGEDYLNEIYEEEKAQLIAALKAIGRLAETL